MTPQRSRSTASLREAAAPAWPDGESEVYCFAASAPARVGAPAAAPEVAA